MTLNPEKIEDQKQFFDYSFYELAKFDLPANIDFVLEKTNQSKISYIGHSQGTTQMFTALAEDIDHMTDKINVFIALAPITYIGGTHNTFWNTITRTLPIVKKMLNSMNTYELFGPNWEQKIHKTEICNWFPEMCKVPSSVPLNEYENSYWRRVANFRPY